MVKLIRLELQRVNLRMYLMTSLILGFLLLLFIYFIANAAQVTQESDFMNYGNIIKFTCVISILLFGVFSSTIYNTLIIKEYTGKQLCLLFSYPIHRKKVFVAKVLIIVLLTFISMVPCVFIPIMIFSITESFLPIVADTITTYLLVSTLKIIVVSVLFANIVGIFAMAVGFIKKSVTMTIISAFVLSSIYGNIAISMSNHLVYSLFIVGASLVVMGIVLTLLSNQIEHMEVQ